LPAQVVKFVLPEVNSIILKCANDDQIFKCKIIKSTRKYVEKFLTTGWYDYVRQNNLIVGYYLNFKLYLQLLVHHMEITPPNMNR
jgi:hypothetical protein